MKFQLDRPRLRWGGMRMRPGEDLAISLVRKWRPPFLPFFCSRRDSFSILQRSQTAPHRVSSVLIETVIIISPIDYRRVRSVCVCGRVCVGVCVWTLGAWAGSVECWPPVGASIARLIAMARKELRLTPRSPLNRKLIFFFWFSSLQTSSLLILLILILLILILLTRICWAGTHFTPLTWTTSALWMTSWGLPDQKESLARFMPLDGAGGNDLLISPKKSGMATSPFPPSFPPTCPPRPPSA